MAIKKNEISTNEITQNNLKINRSLISKKNESKVGRKAFDDEKLRAVKRNTFLLNAYQQEKMEKRMKELNIHTKTDYIVYLLQNDINDF